MEDLLFPAPDKTTGRIADTEIRFQGRHSSPPCRSEKPVERIILLASFATNTIPTQGKVPTETQAA